MSLVIAAVVIVLGIHLCMRVLAALHRIVDLWYTIGTAWPRVARSLAGWTAVTLAVGVAFACLLVAWQSALPTRITGWNDAAWNTVGCAVGAMAAHLRKQLRIRFE